MITRNFRRSEYECRCGCGLADPHPALVVGLQRLRDILRAPITVTSGCRCAAHNEAVGGTADSQHRPRDEHGGYCCAADISTTYSLREMMDHAVILEAFAGGGVGVYAGDVPRLHLDVRGAAGLNQPARWATVNGELATLDEALAEDEKLRKVTA